MYDSKVVRILWIALVLFMGVVFMKLHKDKIEGFANRSDVTQDVIDMYYKNLNRAPTSEELKKHVKAITDKTYDYRELELRLINSDEYQRLIKTQTNTLLPETKRMIEEKDVIELIKRAYLRIRGKKLKKELFLPLKDLYIYFDYNLYKFIALLRDGKYPFFEETIAKDARLSRESLIDLYHNTFDDSKLNYDAEALEKMDKALSKGKRLIDLIKAEEGKTISMEETNTAALLAYLTATTANLNKLKDAEAAKALASKVKVDEGKISTKPTLVTSTELCTGKRRVYLPNESKILKTEYGFSALEKHPPICVPVGRPAAVKEAVLFSDLQGTPLDEAADTQVGSIMPKFEYRRYIEV